MVIPKQRGGFEINKELLRWKNPRTLKNVQMNFSITDFESTSCMLPFQSRKWLFAARAQKVNHFLL